MKNVINRIIGFFLTIVMVLINCIAIPATPVYAYTKSDIDVAEYEKLIEDYFYEHYQEYSQYECYIDVHATSISEMELAYNKSLEYNTGENIYWGYKLSDPEVQALKSGNNYFFLTDEEGNVKPIRFEEYDDTYDKMIRDVAIGTGVIVITATVGVVTAGAGLPAVSMVFVAAAKGSAEFALVSAGIGGVLTYATEMITTGDNKEALKKSVAKAAEEYKVGAIVGLVTGVASEAIMLKTATKAGLTMDEAALIIKESELPVDFVKQIKNYEEYEELLKIAKDGGLALKDMAEICRNTKLPLEVVKYMRNAEEATLYAEKLGLVFEEVGGRAALVREIDLTYKAETNGKMMTNLERMKDGKAALDPITGKSLELHHIGQKVDSPLAILTEGEHDAPFLHDPNIEKGVHKLMTDYEWKTQREKFWTDMYEICEGGTV